jgi:hypothetical protein
MKLLSTTNFPLDGFFMKFDIWGFFENLSRTFKFHWSLTTITAPHMQHTDIHFLSRYPLLKMRNVSDKIYRENKDTFYIQ